MGKRKIYLVILSLIAILLILPAFSIETKAAKSDINLMDNNNIEEELEWIEKELEVTMYTLNECGKAPNHPWYGITSSGKMVTEGKTVAASPEIPFGSKIKIPGFDTTFVVEDRGGMIKTYRGRWPGIIKVDVYTTDKKQALKWGRKKIEGELLVLEK